MQAAFVVGVSETHDKVIPKDILKYYGISIFYKEINNWPAGITASIASAAGITWVQKPDTVVYGIEINPYMPEDNTTKLIAEYTVNAFVDFLYTHYKLEYEHYSDILCIKSKTDFLHLCQPITILPENVNNMEFNITIILSSNTPSRLTTDIKETLSIEIARAGYKLNMACVFLDTSDSGEDSPTENFIKTEGHSKIHFNINTSTEIRAWVHAMKRKAKRKFHCIESFKFEVKKIECEYEIA